FATASSSVPKVAIDRAAGVPWGLISTQWKRPSGWRTTLKWASTAVSPLSTMSFPSLRARRARPHLFSVKSLARQGSRWYLAVHGSSGSSAADGAPPRRARSLPSRSDGRRPGIRLRDDQTAARSRPCDRRRGLHLSVARTSRARRSGRDLPGRERRGPAAEVLPPIERRTPGTRAGRVRMASRPRCRRRRARSRQDRGGFMSDFVEQCRREWKRLGVPDPVAEEMAADLATDLGEAAAEGMSAEALLGSSVFDPRSFAASWAAERGVIPVPQPAEEPAADRSSSWDSQSWQRSHSSSQQRCS